MIRRALLLAHRSIGVALAVALLPIALSGSALVWKEPLDAALNPRLFRASSAPSLDEVEIARRIEAAHPPVQVAWVDLPAAPGASARAQVRNWPDNRPPVRIYNEVFVEPATGAVLGARSTSTPGFNRAEFVPWLRRLHYTFHLKSTGMLIVGGIAIAWLADCFIGAALTLPRRPAQWRKWRLAWRVRGSRAGYDLHRAAGLWLWPVLVVLAASGIYLNLSRQVFVPVVEAMARLLPEGIRDAAVGKVLELQFPLHTGAALGLAGRLLVSVAGLAVTVLAVTGIMTLLRKRAQQPGAGAVPALRGRRPPRGSLP